VLLNHDNTFKVVLANFFMIVVDIECSGVDLEKCGIWQIGAVEIENPSNTFLEEARVEEDSIFLLDPMTPEKLFGKTEKELRDKGKQSEKQLLENFFKWCSKIDNRLFICQHPQFDHAFLEHKGRKYDLKFPTNYKVFDLHSIAHFKYFELNKEFIFKGGLSDMGLKRILSFAGMEDTREEHNALEDAKLSAEAFNRIVYGKSLLEEYSKFKIPAELEQK
jgi:DNA polymerase III epsilon subunit-like protein